MVEQVMDFIEGYDKEIGEAIKAECGCQRRNLELIASENIVSEPVMAAMGTVLTNNYAEGYAGKRYYGGCEFVDVVETIAIERAKKLFGCDYVNVQPHSGAQANMAVFVAMLKPGDTVMGMDEDALRELLDDTASCFYVQQPNYYGNLEECGLLGEITHEKGAKYIMGCNPISLDLLPTPAECGADIAVGDGQPLGMPLCFGGPYLGFMTATSAMGRKLPGRIVGETRDVDGKRAYVLTLQAREQHIRREKASSNVCSNQALCALTASVYMAAMGGEGLRKTAVLCTSKAHYLKEQLEQAGLTARYDREFFHEFVTEGDTDSGLILKALEEKGILGGLPLNDREILWCATEQNRKEDIDQAAQIVKEVCGG